MPEAEDIYLAKLDQTSVGITDENAIQFSVFPNPTHGHLTLQGDLPSGLRYSVYNSLGELIATATLQNKTISTLEWTDGLYFLSLIKEGENIGKRMFLIQR